MRMSTISKRSALTEIIVLLSVILGLSYCASSFSLPFVTAWSCTPSKVPFRFATLEMKRGRGQFGKEIGFDNTSSKGVSSKGNGIMSSSSTKGPQPVINWIPISVSSKMLPTEENVVGIIDTNLPTMKNSQTNPTGAVSVIKYKDATYCFAVNCPSCKIPLTKATVVPPGDDSQGQPRLVCDFCKATYNMKTGKKLKSAVENPGFFGGIAKSIFSTQASGDLKTYQLGERNGKLLIALD